MSAPAVTATGLDPDVMVAAALANGQDIPDASPTARALAARALAAAGRDVMDDIVDAADASYTPSGNRGPRVSDVGACRRSVWYRENPPDGFTPDPLLYRRQAGLGSVIHAQAATVRAARYPWRWYETEIVVPGLDKRARIDEYDPILGEVTDLKTVGTRRWEIVGDYGPDDSAWSQVSVYGYALDELGLPVRSLRIIVVNRDTGAEESFTRDYDPGVARAALDDLIELATMLDLGVTLPRDGSGPGTDWRCRACFARSHCWNIPAAQAADRSPESYTILGPDPTAAVIEWAGLQVLDASAARLAAKKAEAAAKALVDGVPDGTYGDVTVKTTRREMPDYKESFLRAAEFCALPDGLRPSAAEVAIPSTRVDRYPTVSRARAAARGKKAKP
jgi:hypothetical protein